MRQPIHVLLVVAAALLLGLPADAGFQRSGGARSSFGSARTSRPVQTSRPSPRVQTPRPSPRVQTPRPSPRVQTPRPTSQRSTPTRPSVQPARPSTTPTTPSYGRPTREVTVPPSTTRTITIPRTTTTTPSYDPRASSSLPTSSPVGGLETRYSGTSSRPGSIGSSSSSRWLRPSTTPQSPTTRSPWSTGSTLPSSPQGASGTPSSSSGIYERFGTSSPRSGFAGSESGGGLTPGRAHEGGTVSSGTPSILGSGDRTTTSPSSRVRFPAPYRPVESRGSSSDAGAGPRSSAVESRSTTYTRFVDRYRASAAGESGGSEPRVPSSRGSAQPESGASPSPRTAGSVERTGPTERTGDPGRPEPYRAIRDRQLSSLKERIGPGSESASPRSGSLREGLAGRGAVDYGRGPLLRPERPATGAKTGGGDLRPIGSASPRDGVRPRTGGSGKGEVLSGLTPGRSSGGGGPRPGGSTVGTRTLRDLDRIESLRGVRPTRAREVSGAGYALGHAQRVALGVGIRAAGGIYATPYLGAWGYGPRSVYYPTGYAYPWGFGYYGGSFSLTFGWSYWRWNACDPFWWPTYVSCWYPVWYSCYRPYAYFQTIPAAYSTVVYETVYVEREPELEPEVLETVEPEPEPEPAAQPIAPALSIAADRYLSLGDTAFREGRYTDAVQLYAKAIELAPEEGSLYLVLADALFAAGDYHYGAYAVRRALELDPVLVDTQVDKHDFYTRPEDFDHQLAVAEEYVLDHPHDRDARLILALNLLFGGRPAVAVDLLEAEAASSLGGDPAAELVLRSARERQYGEPARSPSEENEASPTEDEE